MKDFAIQEIEDALEDATDNPDFGEFITEHWGDMQLYSPNTYRRLHDFFDIRGEFYYDDGSLDIAKAHELALKKISRTETAALVQMAFELGTLFGLSCRKDFHHD